MAEYYARLETRHKKKRSSIVRNAYILLLYLTLFLHIYRPLFLSFSQYVILILFPLLLISAAFFFWNKSFIYFLKRRETLGLSIGFLCLFIYTAIIDHTSLASNGVSFGLLNSTAIFRTYFDVFLSSVALYLMFKSVDKSTPIDLINAFLWISFLQFLFTLSMMYSPAFRDFINISVLLPNKIVDSYHYQYRLFGLSSEQLFTFPLFNGLALCAALWLAHKKNSIIYLILALCALLPIVVNARIGLISVLAFLISFVVMNYRKIIFLKGKFILKTLFLILLTFLLSVFVFHFAAGLFSERMLNWIVDGASQIFGLGSNGITSDDSTTLDHLLTAHLFFPDTIDAFLFGDSRSYDPSTDIGYVKMIFSGGIIYLISYFSFVYWLFLNAICKAKDYVIRGVLLSGLIMFSIANLKGLVFISNGFLKAMFLLCIFVVLDDILEKNKIRPLS